MEGFVCYCGQRLADDPHLWVTTLFDEVRELGFVGSYQALSTGGAPPRVAATVGGLRSGQDPDRSVIEHPPGEETQWDWLELPKPPQRWGWAGKPHLLLGALPRSSRWRGWLAECEDQPHLIEALHQVATNRSKIT